MRLTASLVCCWALEGQGCQKAGQTGFMLQPARSLSRRRQRSAQTQMVAALSPRRQQFFDTISEGLEKYPPGSVDRIKRFVQFCKGELQLPPSSEYHQPSEEFVEDLEAKPWWEPSDFLWVQALESASAAITEEFKAYMASQDAGFARDSAHMGIMGPGWSGVRLQRLGRWIPENCRQFPTTVGLLQQLEVPLAVRGVIFARQLPKSGVAAHSDGRNFILTTHLGIDVPEGECWMRVGGERREWHNGKALVLDTSFEHETRNDGERPRYVLIIDFWHPQLSKPEQEALAYVYETRNLFETGEVPLPRQNNKGGVAGWLSELMK